MHDSENSYFFEKDLIPFFSIRMSQNVLSLIRKKQQSLKELEKKESVFKRNKHFPT
jgi:hypothetical protein